ncbi:MAG: c-type cytochrome [Chloroflexi bacterium]|nr:c-type cytochrome [Chloroflexota bacterium]
MNDETKKQINAKYERELQRGERFWPDSIFKDVVVSLGLFIVLVLLATFVGVENSPKADPSDTSYIPRPEWYFLFLFKFLALYGQIPVLGKIEWLATVLVPTIGIGLLTLLPFIDKSPWRYYTRRMLPLTVMGLIVIDMVLLTMMSDIPTVAEDGSKLLGLLQTTAGLIVPGLALIALFFMAYKRDENPVAPMLWTLGLAAVLMIGFTAVTLALAPPAEAEEAVASTLVDQITAGQDLYSVHCVECHGDDGKVTVIEGVEGLEGKEVSPINSRDVLYTLNDASMAEIINYGRPDAGMNPFGKAYNAEGLTKSEIDYIVLFMRYNWDDRFEKPVFKPLFPPLADGEVPSYDVHIAPMVKRYCVSCHRAGKENNEFVMTSYDEILTTGDNVDRNLVAGDETSYLLQVIQGHAILNEQGEEIIGVMPPKSTLKAEYIDAWIRWILNGMPQTAEDAAKLFVAPTPAP